MKAAERWGVVHSWKWRAERAAALIQPGSSVIEIGCGNMDLKPLLPADCSYTGADIVPRCRDTVVVDLEAGEFPEGQYDVVVLLGVLEYLSSVSRVFIKARSLAPEMVLSYCATMPGADIDTRETKGWTNHFSERDLLDLLKVARWLVTHREVVQHGARVPTTHVQVLLKCRLATPS